MRLRLTVCSQFHFSTVLDAARPLKYRGVNLETPCTALLLFDQLGGWGTDPNSYI